MPKAHTFTALGMPLAPRGPPPRPLVRFAASICPFQPVSVQRRPSQCLLVRFFPSLFREAHNSPLPSASLRQSASFSMPSGSDAYHSRPSFASLHPQAHFSLFPCSDAHPSALSSASPAPGIFCPVLSRPLRLLGRGAKSVFNSEASPGIPREASLLNIIIVRARKMLPEFFLAYCGDEFFEVEWLEVCDIFEFSCAECRDGRGEHR